MAKKKKHKGIKNQIRKVFSEASQKLNVTHGYICTSRLKDGIWSCTWSVDYEIPSEIDSSIRENAEAELKGYMEMKLEEIEAVLRECFGSIVTGSTRYNFTFHMPPMNIAIPEHWDHVKGEFQKIEDARLMTNEELDKRLAFYQEQGKTNVYFASDAKLLQWERENWQKFFRFVGGSPFSDELFEHTHYAGLRMFGEFTFQAFDIYVPQETVETQASGM